MSLKYGERFEERFCLTTGLKGYNDAFMGFPIFKQNGWFNLIFVFAIPK